MKPEERVVELVAKAIVRYAGSVMGPVALHHVRNVDGVQIGKRSVRLLKRNRKIIDEIISSYQGIMGEAVKGIVIMAVTSELKKHPDLYPYFRKVLPSWVFDAPDVRVLELAGHVW